jgi:hypothetical protein
LYLVLMVWCRVGCALMGCWGSRESEVWGPRRPLLRSSTCKGQVYEGQIQAEISACMYRLKEAGVIAGVRSLAFQAFLLP